MRITIKTEIAAWVVKCCAVNTGLPLWSTGSSGPARRTPIAFRASPHDAGKG